MPCNYKDITSRIAEKPTWYDENGVPRYCEMHPDNRANLLVDEVAFFQVACQDCGRVFNMCVSHWKHDNIFNPSKPEYISYLDSTEHIYWGDPPCFEEPCAGSTMSSNFIGILAIWVRKDSKWVKYQPKMTEVEA